jgi:hypothetical protein
VGQTIAPAAQAVGNVAEQVGQYADKNWPQPPPIRMNVPKPSPLPPIKKKNPLPPPIRPGSDFRRS